MFGETKRSVRNAIYAWTAAVLVFMYIPIVVVIMASFVKSRYFENFPNIYFDVGFVQNWAGPSYQNMMKEALELAPFTKQLFSTDAFGLSELYYLGAMRFRNSLRNILDNWIELDECTPEYADQIMAWIGGANARRIYAVPTEDAARAGVVTLTVEGATQIR